MAESPSSWLWLRYFMTDWRGVTCLVSLIPATLLEKPVERASHARDTASVSQWPASKAKAR